jgi:hypothetical protein
LVVVRGGFSVAVGVVVLVNVDPSAERGCHLDMPLVRRNPTTSS